MKIQKITNPLYIGEVAPLVLKFYNRIKETSGVWDGITYETLYAFIVRIVQFGVGTKEDRAEFWIAYDDDNTPTAFALWRLMDLPHIGTVYCDFMYNDARNQKAIKGLYDEFINFGRRHRAPLYQFNAINEKVGEYFRGVFDKLGFESKDSGSKNIIGRER